MCTALTTNRECAPRNNSSGLATAVGVIDLGRGICRATKRGQKFGRGFNYGNPIFNGRRDISAVDYCSARAWIECFLARRATLERRNIRGAGHVVSGLFAAKRH